ncbi:MAG: TIGR03862 family flavoprotein [Rhodobacteraceae bacterium]|nr:MAG: TIGR03862 family flavoprotein [Paracoccaceae bacterium]
MAAEALAGAGHGVILTEARPSLGRKFLMAGKSGLNLTKSEDMDRFRAAYAEAAPHLAPLLDAFGPAEVCRWAEGLGQPLFTGSTGRVFPVAMKASPLLRAWIARLAGLGVTFRTRWRWTGWEGEAWAFDTPDGAQSVKARVTVLALGGASWARLGSDGDWARLLAARGIGLTPFAPSNAGIALDWSAHMTPHFGAPLKAVAFRAGDITSRGEAVISAAGLEGGGVYPLTPAIRRGLPLTLDLAPDLDAEALARRLGDPGKTTLTTHLRKLRLSPVALALAMEWGRPLPRDARGLAQRLKALPVPYRGTAPMDQAISTAGGVPFAALDGDLMLKDLPGTYCAGEMLDWEAPTGGYLLTACLATGLHAGRAAARRLVTDRPS